MIIKMATTPNITDATDITRTAYQGFGALLFAASITAAAVFTTTDRPVYVWPLTYAGIALLIYIFRLVVNVPSDDDNIFSTLLQFILFSPIYFILKVFKYLFGYDQQTEGALKKLRKKGIPLPKPGDIPLIKRSDLSDYSTFYFAGSKSLSYDKEYVMTKEGKLTKPVFYATIILILVAIIPLISISASPNNIPINGANYWHDLLPTMIGFISAIILFIYGTVKGGDIITY